MCFSTTQINVDKHAYECWQSVYVCVYVCASPSPSPSPSLCLSLSLSLLARPGVHVAHHLRARHDVQHTVSTSRVEGNPNTPAGFPAPLRPGTHHRTCHSLPTPSEIDRGLFWAVFCRLRMEIAFSQNRLKG